MGKLNKVFKITQETKYNKFQSSKVSDGQKGQTPPQKTNTRALVDPNSCRLVKYHTSSDARRKTGSNAIEF